MVNVLIAQHSLEPKEMERSVDQTHAISDKELWKTVLVHSAHCTLSFPKTRRLASPQPVLLLKFFIRMVSVMSAHSTRNQMKPERFV